MDANYRIMNVKHISERPRFQNLQSAIDFISKCVDDNDAETLINACEIKPKELFLSTLFENIKLLMPMIKWEFLESDFPPDYLDTNLPPNNEFTIGGCGLKWRWTHIVFKKTEDGWYLHEIILCR
jgi:hypothetical protein